MNADPQKHKGTIEFTRACARSDQVIVVSAVLTGSDLYAPESRLFRFEHNAAPAEQWYFDDFDFHMQDMTLFSNPEIDASTDYLTYLSSEGDVFHAWWKDNFREKILGAGTWVSDAKGHGRLSAITHIGGKLYASGQGGQIYCRHGQDKWSLLTDQLLFDVGTYQKMRQDRPATDDPAYLPWLLESRKQAPKNISFNAIRGLSEDAIYLCGEEGVRPVLYFWDGTSLHEMKVHLDEAALTGIYIENPDSVWICGREGVLLHGSNARGFTPVNLRRQLNLFHMITPFRDLLVLPSSVRPGGLFTFDPVTEAFERFSPALPQLVGDYIFYAGAFGDVLWVVGQKDIFRLVGNEWERIGHPDL